MIYDLYTIPSVLFSMSSELLVGVSDTTSGISGGETPISHSSLPHGVSVNVYKQTTPEIPEVICTRRTIMDI
jgi:hypothetical protein